MKPSNAPLEKSIALAAAGASLKVNKGILEGHETKGLKIQPKLLLGELKVGGAGRLDFPEPLSPVITVSLLRGISMLMFLRLCCRAPRTVMLSMIRCIDFRFAGSENPPF